MGEGWGRPTVLWDAPGKKPGECMNGADQTNGWEAMRLFCLWWDATQKQGWANWVTGDERGPYLGNRQQEPANGLKGSPQHCYCSDFGSCCVFYNLTQSSWLFCHHIKSLFLSYATRCLGSFMRNLSPSFRNVPSNFVFFSPCFWVLSGITLLYAQDLCLPAFED